MESAEEIVVRHVLHDTCTTATEGTILRVVLYMQQEALVDMFGNQHSTLDTIVMHLCGILETEV